jgi:integrase
VTIHDLRRTHSTRAAISGVDLRTLAARIGHSDLTMLQKHYAAVVGSGRGGGKEDRASIPSIVKGFLHVFIVHMNLASARAFLARKR